MSIRLLALDLYRARQKVDKLLKELENCPLQEQQEKERLKQELRYAEQEHKLLRKMLDGEKESGETRKKFSGFGTRRSNK